MTDLQRLHEAAIEAFVRLVDGMCPNDHECDDTCDWCDDALTVQRFLRADASLIPAERYSALVEAAEKYMLRHPCPADTCDGEDDLRAALAALKEVSR